MDGQTMKAPVVHEQSNDLHKELATRLEHVRSEMQERQMTMASEERRLHELSYIERSLMRAVEVFEEDQLVPPVQREEPMESLGPIARHPGNPGRYGG